MKQQTKQPMTREEFARQVVAEIPDRFEQGVLIGQFNRMLDRQERGRL